MINWIVVVLVFAFLIVFHEYGHYAFGKLFGVRVDEFSVGFGPRLAGFHRGETDYSLRILPLGGFCRLAGLEAEPDDLARDQLAPRDETASGRDAAAPIPESIPPGRSFRDKPFWQRLLIIAAGPLFNIALAVLFFALVFSWVGVPGDPTLLVQSVQSGTPAQQVGLQTGDRLISVNGVQLSDWSDFQHKVLDSHGEEIRLGIERDGQQRVLTIIPKLRDDGTAYIGVYPASEMQRMPVGRGLGQAFVATWGVLVGWFQGIGMMFSNAAGVDVMGPIGIGEQIYQASQLGAAYLLMWAALISANLGLINLLPIPALDGSHLLFIAIEWVRGRPVDPDKQNTVTFIGFALLMLLMLVITYRDLVRIFS